MTKVTLKWGAVAAKGKEKIGTWHSSCDHGVTSFHGVLTATKEKSPALKKRELREWFEQKSIKPPRSLPWATT